MHEPLYIIMKKKISTTILVDVTRLCGEDFPETHLVRVLHISKVAAYVCVYVRYNLQDEIFSDKVYSVIIE